MKTKLLSCLSVIAFSLTFAGLSFAQEDEKVASAAGDMYVISAKAGGVNYVEGKVAVSRPNSKSGYLLKGDRLEVGERVSTGTNGKAEILLNPGSYVRLGENSVFEFVSTSLDNVKVKLISGSAMLEVFADDEFRVAIAAPKADFYAIKTGVYRIDAMPDGSARLSVWKGKAQVGDESENILKKGRMAVVANGQVEVEKFDRGDKDALEEWSKDRAKELAKINAKLERGNLRNSLINSFNQRGWGLYDSFGLWVYDRFSGYYCFVPFGYGWSSPYGYWYDRDLWYFRLPRYVYNQPQPATTSSNNPTTSPEPRSRPRSSTVKSPPFERVGSSVDRKTKPIFDDPMPPMAPSASPSVPSRVVVPAAPVSVPRGSKGKPE